MNYNINIYRQLNYLRVLVQIEIGFGLLHYTNMSNISLPSNVEWWVDGFANSQNELTLAKQSDELVPSAIPQVNLASS